MALRFMVWLGIFTPLAFVFDWVPLGDVLEAAALGLVAGVALAAAVFVAAGHTPTRPEASNGR